LIRLRGQSAQTNYNPIFVGIDEGKAKLCYGVVCENLFDDPFKVVFTCCMYYSQIKFKRRKKQWENRVKENRSSKD